MSSTEKFHKQRALIFQGGGALGAYEAGVYRIYMTSFWSEREQLPYKRICLILLLVLRLAPLTKLY